jgi:hypothetical protein
LHCETSLSFQLQEPVKYRVYIPLTIPRLNRFIQKYNVTIWAPIKMAYINKCSYMFYYIVWNGHRYKILYIPHGPKLMFEVETIGSVDIYSVRHSLFWNLWKVPRDLYEHLFIYAILIGAQIVTLYFCINLFKRGIVRGM